MGHTQRIHQASLPRVLRRIIPEVLDQAHGIESKELSSNAGKSRHVYLHRLHDENKNNILSLIEKTSATRWPDIDPEAFFYAELGKINGNTGTPPYYGSVTTRRGTHIFLGHIEGSHPDLTDVATDEIARCIAGMELATSRKITRWSFLKNRGYLLFDSFFPAHRFEPAIRAQLNAQDSSRAQEAFRELTGRSPALSEQANRIMEFLSRKSGAIRRSTKCFSHMDFRAQNLIHSDQGLYLLDWGAAKIGRIGFDAGAFLAAMLMRQGTGPFRQTADHFLSSYRNLISPHFAWDPVQMNCSYVFLARSLSYFLKPGIIARHIDTGRIDTLMSKHQYLISLFNSIKSS